MKERYMTLFDVFAVYRLRAVQLCLLITVHEGTPTEHYGTITDVDPKTRQVSFYIDDEISIFTIPSQVDFENYADPRDSYIAFDLLPGYHVKVSVAEEGSLSKPVNSLAQTIDDLYAIAV